MNKLKDFLLKNENSKSLIYFTHPGKDSFPTYLMSTPMKTQTTIYLETPWEESRKKVSFWSCYLRGSLEFELQQLTILRTHLLGPGTAAEFPLKRPNPTFFKVWIKTYRTYQVSTTSRKHAELMLILWFRSDNFHKLRG